jgi:hypothetical protein
MCQRTGKTVQTAVERDEPTRGELATYCRHAGCQKMVKIARDAGVDRERVLRYLRLQGRAMLVLSAAAYRWLMRNRPQKAGSEALEIYR